MPERAPQPTERPSTSPRAPIVSATRPHAEWQATKKVSRPTWCVLDRLPSKNNAGSQPARACLERAVAERWSWQDLSFAPHMARLAKLPRQRLAIFLARERAMWGAKGRSCHDQRSATARSRQCCGRIAERAHSCHVRQQCQVGRPPRGPSRPPPAGSPPDSQS
jgi:hypothetical protein